MTGIILILLFLVFPLHVTQEHAVNGEWSLFFVVVVVFLFCFLAHVLCVFIRFSGQRSPMLRFIVNCWTLGDICQKHI